jgi:arylsulfatase A-like enzyme
MRIILSALARSVVGLCLLWLALLVSAGHAANRPNIILILADDLGYETVGCYGGESYATPHLDRLAAGGVRFDRAYAMPLCTNTRTQLMTGKYNTRIWKAFGILDPQQRTFGHLLQAAGYKTCMAGKWQLTSYDPPDYPGAELRRSTGMRVANAGFDETSLWHTSHTEDKGSRYADPVIEQNGQQLTDTQGKYGPDLWTDFIGDFMTRHRDEPFFVYYSMALPHNPMNPTPDSPEWQDPEQRDDDVTRFAADMIRYTDKMVGKVVAKVDELGLRENTLILFFSDNGTNWRVQSQFRGQMVRGEKGKGTELGVRVPMIANWSGTINAGQTSQALIDSVDFLPTMLEVAGLADPLPPDVDGVSFLPLLKGESDGTRQHVYIHQDPRPGWDKDRFELLRLAIGPRYKLYEDGRLYDVVDDMFERQPIFINADNAAERQARQALQQVLDAHTPSPMFDPRQVPRPDPNAQYAKHAFQDQGGLVVIEAEQIPFARDESWVVENALPDYTGLGYLRAIREQPTAPNIGDASVAVSLDNAGDWSLAFRCRSDHVDTQHERSLWVRHEKGVWQRVTLPSDATPGQWTWVTLQLPDAARPEQPTTSQIALRERRNVFYMAPCSQNLKIDRLVVFQADRQQDAMQLTAPASAFHPWASP